jgi:hypothetical protein
MSTVSRFRYRWDHAVLNGLAKLAGPIGLGFANLDIEHARLEAERITGLTDWGGGGMFERLAVLSEMFIGGPMSAIGKISHRATWVESISNRLRLIDWERRNPETEAAPLASPVVIVGLPRTGTTALHHLLAAGPELRGIRFWELFSPVPRSDDPIEDRRIRRKTPKTVIRAANYFAPEQRHVHYISMDTYEECWPLLFNSFGALSVDLVHGLWDWGDYLFEHADMDEVYRGYRAQLRSIGADQPTRLVVKCPEHLWFLESLLNVFPDARIVWTHRDPADALASYASLATLGMRTMCGAVEPAKLSQHLRRRFAQAVDRGMAARDAHERGPGSATFVDVGMSEIRHRPLETARRVMAELGLEVTPAHERAMQAWIDRPRPDAAGKHRYDEDLFSVDRDAMAEEFRDYAERFEF